MGNNSVPKFTSRLSRFPVYRGPVLGRFYCITSDISFIVFMFSPTNTGDKVQMLKCALISNLPYFLGHPDGVWWSTLRIRNKTVLTFLYSLFWHFNHKLNTCTSLLSCSLSSDKLCRRVANFLLLHLTQHNITGVVYLVWFLAVVANNRCGVLPTSEQNLIHRFCLTTGWC